MTKLQIPKKDKERSSPTHFIWLLVILFLFGYCDLIIEIWIL